MFGNISAIGYLQGLKFNKDVNLKKESYIEQLIKEQWEKDKDQIINGYKNGTERTQHGVNAEHFHAAIKNTEEIRQAATEGRVANLIEKSPLVNGPDDLIQGSNVIQMKFYRDTNGSLTGCMEHLEKYADTYADNANAFYVIPPEQLEQLIDIKNGRIPEGMSSYQADILKDKIDRFESLKGESIEKAIEPGALTYEEAQLKNIDTKSKETEEACRKQHEEEAKKIEKSIEPSVLGAMKAAMYAAGFGGVTAAALHVYNDYQKGKNLFNGDYRKEDYKKLCKATSKGAGQAGLSGLLYYAVSAAVKQKILAASFITNMIKGIAPLKMRFLRGEITFKQFIDLSRALSVVTFVNSLGEAGTSLVTAAVFSGLGALGVAPPAAVSVVIGIVLSLIGGMVFSILLDMCKGMVNRYYTKIKEEFNAFLVTVSDVYGEKVARLQEEFEALTACASTMDNRNNSYASRVEASNTLSEKYGTNKLDPNESIASLKARFLKK